MSDSIVIVDELLVELRADARALGEPYETSGDNALGERIVRALALIDRLREERNALAAFTSHRRFCNVNADTPCSCGLAAALANVPEGERC